MPVKRSTVGTERLQPNLAGTKNLDGISRVVDVAERVRALPVTHQPLDVLGKLASDVERYGQVLVLFLTQPAERVVHVDPDAGLVRRVRTTAVHGASGVEHDRACRHLRGNGGERGRVLQID